MKYVILFVVVSLLVTTLFAVAVGQTKPAVDHAWSWTDEDASLMASVRLIPAEHFKFTAEVDSEHRDEITATLVYESAKPYTWKTGSEQMFRVADGTLYLARYSPSASGGWIVAYDLVNEQIKWKTFLHALGDIEHFRYENRIFIESISTETIVVFGRESAGRYVETLDRKTGKTLKHQIVK